MSVYIHLDLIVRLNLSNLILKLFKPPGSVLKPPGGSKPPACTTDLDGLPLPHSPILYLGWACISGGSVTPWSCLIWICQFCQVKWLQWSNHFGSKTEACLKGLTCLSSAAGLFLVRVEGTAPAAAEAADVYPGTNHYHYMAKKATKINGGPMKNKWNQMKVITWYHDLSYLEGKVNLILDILDNVSLHPCMVTCI